MNEAERLGLPWRARTSRHQGNFSVAWEIVDKGDNFVLRISEHDSEINEGIALGLCRQVNLVQELMRSLEAQAQNPTHCTDAGQWSGKRQRARECLEFFNREVARAEMELGGTQTGQQRPPAQEVTEETKTAPPPDQK